MIPMPIQPYLWAGQNTVLGHLSAELLDGHDVGGILNDYLDESGLMEGSMLELEVGKSYLFKTFGLHYLGRVVKANHNVILLSNVSLVVDVGETMAAFSQGTISYQEPYPRDYQVRLNPLHVYAAEDWKRKLPNE